MSPLHQHFRRDRSNPLDETHAGGQDRPPWQSGGVQGREPPRRGLAHAGKQEGRVGPAALGEIRRSFVLRPERIG